MRVAHWASGKSATVAHLPPSALYVLSSNGVPEEFVLDVLKRVDAGEKIAASAVRQELRTFQQTRGAKPDANDVDAQPVLDKVTAPPTYDRALSCPTPIAELAGLLARKLAADDFARVCEILTSEILLSDPDLAEKLAQQFRSAAESSLVFA